MKRTLGLLIPLVLLAADGPADEASRKDLECMQGDWAMESFVRDGDKLSDDDAQSLFRNVKGNDYTVFLFDKPIGKGTFQIDATKKPKTIDSFPAGAPDKSKPIRGIYELDGDTLRVCYGAPGKDRPTEFASKPGSGHTLQVLKREKK